MTRIALPLLLAATMALAPTAASAQAADVEGAISAGAVGEQADGYLGFPRAPSPPLRAAVEAINIKRREGYTQVAQSRNVPIEAFAASIGCKTLAGLRTGRSYSVARGIWSVKADGPIALPAQCGQ